MSTTKRSVSEPLRIADYGLRIAPGIEVLNRQRQFKIDRRAAANLAAAVLERIGRADAELTITFIRDAAMQQLNREYRGKDKPTDVLSFAYHESDDGFAESDTHLGDVVISVETASRYAAEFGLTFDREIEHLIIHGTLHLAGYDHETDNGEMNRLERKLRKEFLR
ncbi:MAG: rRNA maturation RNase YbeY [Acidobacteria bacterium]|nr:rRNA maturation RNase YbeY [Acidobacteriota bacterium]